MDVTHRFLHHSLCPIHIKNVYLCVSPTVSRRFSSHAFHFGLYEMCEICPVRCLTGRRTAPDIVRYLTPTDVIPIKNVPEFDL